MIRNNFVPNGRTNGMNGMANDKTPGNYGSWATLTLGLVSLGFFLSYPFRDSFWGGLISTACRAGMLAGLADWFAVTALFRRPLGIRPGRILRTEIIPRNRERLFDALADMVENELLSKEALKERLTHYNSAAFLLSYLSQPDVLEELSLFLTRFIQDLAGKAEPQALMDFLDKLVDQDLLLADLSPFLLKLLNSSEERGYLQQALAVASRSLLPFASLPELKQALAVWLEEAYRTYEAGNTARKLVDTFLPSPDELAEGIQEQLSLFLAGPTARDLLVSWLKEYTAELINSEQSRTHFGQALLHFLRQIIWDKPVISGESSLPPKNSAPFHNASSPEHNTPPTQNNAPSSDNSTLKLLIRELLLEFIAAQKAPVKESRLDAQLKKALLHFIDTQHAAIGRMVRQSLEPLSNTLLVELIESRAGNDLQMIRINGSVVGSLAGSLIYLTYFLIQQRW